MRTVSHREMRNSSGEILRAVAAGETIQVTNRGQVVARIVPAENGTYAELKASGQVRPARRPRSSLCEIRASAGPLASAEILADVRGRW